MTPEWLEELEAYLKMREEAGKLEEQCDGSCLDADNFCVCQWNLREQVVGLRTWGDTWAVQLWRPNMRSVWRISVHGCDDSTHIEMELTEDEAALVRLIAEKITAASSYGCMPSMSLESTEEAQHA